MRISIVAILLLVSGCVSGTSALTSGYQDPGEWTNLAERRLANGAACGGRSLLWCNTDAAGTSCKCVLEQVVEDRVSQIFVPTRGGLESKRRGRQR